VVSGARGGADGRRPFNARVAADPERPLLIAAASVAALVTFLLARSTLLPGLGFWDTAEAQVVPPVLGTFHPTGFPAYVLLGWLASVVLQPFGDAAFRMNLLSAILAAGSAALTVVLVRQLTGHTILGLAVGLVLGAAPVVWRLATHADAHMLHLLLVALLVILLAGWERRTRARDPGSDRWLVAAAIVYGVSLANHTLTLLLAPGIALFVLAVDRRTFLRPRLLANVAVALVVTVVLLYLELPLRAGPFRAPLVYGDPSTWDGFRYVVFAEQFRSSLYMPFDRLPEKFGDLIRFGGDQLGPLLVLVPIGFVATVLRRRAYAVLTGTGFLITTWFSASYVNAEIDRYYLVPILFALTWIAILAGAVLDALVAFASPPARQPALPPATDGGIPPVTAESRPASLRPPSGIAGARATGALGIGALVLEVALAASLLVPTIQELPERRERVDQSQNTVASAWSRAALGAVEPDAIIVSWWSYSTTLWYAQLIEGLRPDVWIIDDRTRLDLNLGDVTDVIDAQLGRRPIYVVRLDASELVRLETTYELERIDMPTEQPLLRVIAPRRARTQP
jgi:hypothetical protein